MTISYNLLIVAWGVDNWYKNLEALNFSYHHLEFHVMINNLLGKHYFQTKKEWPKIQGCSLAQLFVNVGYVYTTEK